MTKPITVQFRIGDDHAFPAALLLLGPRQGQKCSGLTVRNQQGKRRVHAMIARVRNHHVARRGERLFHLARHLGIKRREHELGRAARLALVDRKFPCCFGHRVTQPPAAGFRVSLARRPLRGREPCHFEPRVMFEQAHKPLPHHARGA